MSRVRAMQAALNHLGVRDLQFATVQGADPRKLAKDKLDVLEAILQGRTRPAGKLGDSVRANG